LFELTNPALEQELRAARARRAEAVARQRVALDEGGVNLRTIEQYAAAAEQQIERVAQEVAALRGAAPGPGVWHAAELEQQAGRFFARGTPLGEILGADGFEVVAVVSQRDASRLFSGDARAVRARISGAVWSPLETSTWDVVPGQRTRLPSAALGWNGGGPIEIDASDGSGTVAREPFFEVRARLVPGAGAVILRHGQTAKVHFRLPAQPLFTQCWRWLRQLAQERYQI
jgi:putative peptide zinc metalloprotease protein